MSVHLHRSANYVSLLLATQQNFSLPPPPPAQPPRQFQPDYSSSYDPQDVAEMEISPNFIDALSQSMGFNEADEEYHKGLHAFPKVYSCICPSNQRLS